MLSAVHVTLSRSAFLAKVMSCIVMYCGSVRTSFRYLASQVANLVRGVPSTGPGSAGSGRAFRFGMPLEERSTSTSPPTSPTQSPPAPQVRGQQLAAPPGHYQPAQLPRSTALISCVSAAAFRHAAAEPSHRRLIFSVTQGSLFSHANQLAADAAQLPLPADEDADAGAEQPAQSAAKRRAYEPASQTPANGKVDSAPAGGGWSAALLQANAAATRKATEAVEAEIKKAAGGTHVVSCVAMSRQTRADRQDFPRRSAVGSGAGEA